MWQVWVFLAPLCPICQDYTHYLNELEASWTAAYGEQVEMTGWFPDPQVTAEQVDAFGERYGVYWRLALDTVGWADALGARWTPEAFVVSPSGQIAYRGRVNDLYYALGKHRPAPRHRDLALAIEQAMEGQEILPDKTDAIGCPIERRYPFRDSLAVQLIPGFERPSIMD